MVCGGGVSGLKFTAKPATLENDADVTAYAYNLATRYTLDTTGAYVQDVAYYTADASQIARLTNAGDQIFYYAPSFQNITRSAKDFSLWARSPVSSSTT